MCPRVWQCANQTIRQWRGLHVRQGNGRAVGKPGETFGVCSERTDGGVGREPGLDGWDFERRTQNKTKKKRCIQVGQVDKRATKIADLTPVSD